MKSMNPILAPTPDHCLTRPWPWGLLAIATTELSYFYKNLSAVIFIANSLHSCPGSKGIYIYLYNLMNGRKKDLVREFCFNDTFPEKHMQYCKNNP